MPSYRLSGFSFNRDNLRGIDADALKGINSYLNARETAINTIATETFICAGGPFDGQPIELECVRDALGMSHAVMPQSAPLTVGAWSGRYEVVRRDSSFAAVWCDNCASPGIVSQDTQFFYKVPARAKPAKSIELGRGFVRLGQFLASMAEQQEGEFAHFRIGRTAFKVLNNPERIEELRARVIKAKKWYADKYLQDARAVSEPATADCVPDVAADVSAFVASMDAIAQAMAGPADAAPVPELATVAMAGGCDAASDVPGGGRADAGGSCGPGWPGAPAGSRAAPAWPGGGPTGPEPMGISGTRGNSDVIGNAVVVPDQSSFCPSSAADRRALRARGVAPACIDDAIRALGDGHRVFVAHDMDGEPMEILGVDALHGYTADQCIILPAAKPAETSESEWRHTSVCELACVRRCSIAEAEALAAPHAARMHAEYLAGASVHEMCRILGELVPARFDPKSVDLDALTVGQVQGWSAEELLAVLDYLTDINYHGECLTVRALRIGRQDLVDESSAINAAHLAAGHLTMDLWARQQQLGERIRDAELNTPLNGGTGEPVAKPVQPVENVRLRPLDPALVKLKRRLERWELRHLREHAADLAQRLEEAESLVASAEQAADFWHDQFMLLEESLDSEDGGSHRAIGLTKSGELLVVKMDPNGLATAGGAEPTG